MKKKHTAWLMHDIGLLKIMRIMRFTIFVFLISLSQTFAFQSYSQQTKLTLDLRGVRVEKVLDEVEKSSEFFFLYNKNMVDVDRVVDVKVEGKNINEILDLVFKGTDISYSIKDRHIMLVNNQLMGNGVSLQVQNDLTVSGKVADSSGQPLPGVTVIIKGTSQGTVTDDNGRYSLSDVPGDATLVFSFVGMKSQEILVGGKNLIDVILADETIGIDEVVAIGYGTVKKSDLTGSVASVSSSDLGDRQVSDIGSLIQGKVSGVDVAQGKIRIRGVTTFNNTDPLVVIDGFIGGNLGTVNANDIESIEILKDASATAIYGSRGANGVILVSTKGGQIGPLKVKINAYTGIATTPKKLDVLNASQYIDYMTDLLQNGGQTLSEKLKTPAVREDVTYWQDEVFRTAHTTEFSIDFAGGTDRTKYFMSIGHKYNESIAIGPYSNTTYIRNKNDFNLCKWFRMGNNFAFNYTTNKGVAPWLPYAIEMPPYLPVYDPTQLGGYSYANTDTDRSGAYHPLPSSTLSHPMSVNFGYQTNLWAEIEPIKGLVYRIQAGVSGNFSHDKNWDEEFSGGNRYRRNGATEGSSYGFSPLIENTLTYKHIFGKHDLSVMVGNTWQDYAYGGGISIAGQDYANTEVKNVFLAGSRNISGQNSWNYAYLSYFGRLNYQFNNKYLLTVNMRRDGSPRFAPQNRWGTFPSVALAWKMHEEPFVKDMKVFDQLKLRASWGVSGNDAIGDFRYVSQVWTSGIYYPIGGSAIPGATIKDNASGDIKWESTDSKNIAVDMAFLKNSLTVTADYFIKNTNDILFTVPRPASLGFGLAYGGDAIVNAASVENKGFEMQLGYKGDLGGLHYTINANYTNVKNEVTSLGLGQPYLAGNSRTDIGNPIGYFFGYEADGVFMKQSELDAANAAAQSKGFDYYQESATRAGDVRFKDVNGDGHITGDDRTMIGNSIPKHLYGLNITLDYKGFDVIAYFQGIAGSDHFYGDYIFLRGGVTTNNQEAYVLDRWRSEADPGNGIVPRAIIGDPNNNNRPSSLMVQSGSYLKLRQLSIGYTLPEYLTSKIGLENVRVYANASNLLTISNYLGYDPEVGGDNLNRGADTLPTPNPRSMVLGIQIGF